MRERVCSAFGFVGAPKDFIDVGGRSTDSKMILESGITLSDLDDDFLNSVMFLKVYRSAAHSGNTSRGLGSS